MRALEIKAHRFIKDGVPETGTCRSPSNQISQACRCVPKKGGHAPTGRGQGDPCTQWSGAASVVGRGKATVPVLRNKF